MTARSVAAAVRDRASLAGQRVTVHGRLVSDLADTWLEGDDGARLTIDVPGLARALLPQLDPYVGGPRVYDDPAEVEGVLADLGGGDVRLRALTRLLVHREDEEVEVDLGRTPL